MSNHDRAIEYLNKCKILGRDILSIQLLPKDKVELIKVLDKNSTGRIIIPSFITKINNRAPFAGCRFSEVYIENAPRKSLSAEGLFTFMESNKLRIVFKHPEEITNMKNMFFRCKNLEYLDLSQISGGNVRAMQWMFSGCKSLRRVDFGNINTERVRDMRGMFSECGLLEHLDLSSFDTSSVEDMTSMFLNCESLKLLDISNFKTNSLVEAKLMFYGCTRLEYVNMREFNRRIIVGSPGIFDGCRELKCITIDRGDIKGGILG